ncbi:hypothetical protein GDO86_008105 [Hymenochirus boettgeri]|uniref:Uncharacterized protein n=1 Tax=Hymenochirus boettgeri TaxID=247094 RepID=A0A8T2J077_9PIPI|nr:hypothetical protein GDO86_008105 [Hymenochirus boettgeri]
MWKHHLTKYVHLIKKINTAAVRILLHCLINSGFVFLIQFSFFLFLTIMSIKPANTLSIVSSGKSGFGLNHRGLFYSSSLEMLCLMGS